MAYINWKDKYDVGVEVFNDAHKVLINYINELYSGLQAGFNISEMGYILDGLVNYTHVHFSHEERVMEEFSYPGLKGHKVEHARLIKEVQDYKDQFDAGKKAFSLELMVFLKDWLMNHIMGTDKRYKEFFSDKDVRADR